MVALFVVATILLCVGIELLRDRAKQRKAAPSAALIPADRFFLPKGFFISKAHTWVELTFAGEARVGVDDFAQKVIGSIDRIEVAPLNKELNKGDTLLTVAHGNRVLSIPAPISGKVLTVNESLLASPQMLHQDPYVAGWVAVIVPKNISAELRLLTIADDAAKWLRKEVSRFRDFIKEQVQIGVPAPAGITMLDGGAPLNGVLEQFNENTWNAFQKEFLKAE
jgi:Glycine cleavage system H protein (lipoate-binding)